MENKKQQKADELKDIAPELAQIPRKNSFSVPADYFQKLQANINEKIAVRDSEKSFFRSPAFARYLSATLLSMLILAVSFFYFNRNEKDTLLGTEFEINAEELISSSYLLGMDEFYIKETIAESEADLNYLTLQDADLEDYLIETDFDENLIIHEL
jgi:hypothetical protein